MRKNLLCLILILVLVFSAVPLTAVASEGDDDEGLIAPFWVNVASISNTININGSMADCSYYTRAYSNVAKIVVTAKLERYQNGTWTNVYTHSKTSNTVYAYGSFSVSVNTSYSHRLNSTFKYYDSGGKLLETVQRISYP